MKKLSLIFSLFLVCMTASAVLGQDQKQKDRDMLIKAASFLEAKPFDKDAKNIRGWAVGFVIETDQVHLIACAGGMMEPLLEKKNKNGSELLGQYMIGMAAFKLADPTKKDDENAAQLAGIESALKAYEVMIAEKPKTRFAGMDDLIAKRDKGELKGLVEAAACTTKK